jgi:hypothetical protein
LSIQTQRKQTACYADLRTYWICTSWIVTGCAEIYIIPITEPITLVLKGQEGTKRDETLSEYLVELLNLWRARALLEEALVVAVEGALMERGSLKAEVTSSNLVGRAI